MNTLSKTILAALTLVLCFQANAQRVISENPKSNGFNLTLGVGGMGFTNYHLRVDAGFPIYKRLGGQLNWGHTIWNVQANEGKADKNYLNAGLSFMLFGTTYEGETQVGGGSTSSGNRLYFSYYNMDLKHYLGMSVRGGFLKTTLTPNSSDGYHVTTEPYASYNPWGMRTIAQFNAPYFGIALEDKVNSKVEIGGKLFFAVYKKSYFMDLIFSQGSITQANVQDGNKPLGSNVMSVNVAMDSTASFKAKRGIRFGYELQNAKVGMGFELGLLPRATTATSTALFNGYLGWKFTYCLSSWYRKKA